MQKSIARKMITTKSKIYIPSNWRAFNGCTKVKRIIIRDMTVSAAISISQYSFIAMYYVLKYLCDTKLCQRVLSISNVKKDGRHRAYQQSWGKPCTIWFNHKTDTIFHYSHTPFMASSTSKELANSLSKNRGKEYKD
jgi:hypothetical protein